MKLNRKVLQFGGLSPPFREAVRHGAKIPAPIFDHPDYVRHFDAPFWIDKNAVTNTQYGSAGSYSGPKRPRENLTWFEARDFCVKRGARLPTEAEWEYAARGPDSLVYPWGNDLVAENLAYDRNMVNNADTADVAAIPPGHHGSARTI